ncbi:predicted protein [Histoplasma capsulatum G186AR]|uniref:EXPERA domain-containing protein n=1 Tax=Ajellomyces capsulatus (strain G186AR / H82 / ATCC MYA-2454 / RMSCC 2432) TaxID=447093 RepID=C0NZ85_AJECG|nr:uncharacterized protein HCBG_08465 [Histoplasma capsulatum G186AR]EEH03133.1 predicted protein [Histoplasma capsulatum G186AR]
MASTSSQSAQPRSIWSRKSDILYVGFLSTTVFLAFAIDLVPFYPAGLFPHWSRAIYDFYVSNYNDPLYVRDPPFFKLFVMIEIVLAVPLSLWGIRGIIQGPLNFQFITSSRQVPAADYTLHPQILPLQIRPLLILFTPSSTLATASLLRVRSHIVDSSWAKEVSFKFFGTGQSYFDVLKGDCPSFGQKSPLLSRWRPADLFPLAVLHRSPVPMHKTQPASSPRYVHES